MRRGFGPLSRRRGACENLVSALKSWTRQPTDRDSFVDTFFGCLQRQSMLKITNELRRTISHVCSRKFYRYQQFGRNSLVHLFFESLQEEIRLKSWVLHHDG